MNGDGVDSSINCIGVCNSKLFESRRKHRPLILSCAENIHLQPTVPPNSRCQPIEPIMSHTLPAIKRMRKRRDRARKASGEQQGADIFIKIPHESDDEEDWRPRSRPLLVRFLFWFCGILIVIFGVGSLIYAIIALFSMDSIKSATTLKTKSDTKLMRKFSGKRIGKTAGNFAPWDTTFPP